MSFLAKSMFLTPLIARSAATNFLDKIEEAHNAGDGLVIDTKFFEKVVSFSAVDCVPLDRRDENGKPIIEFLEGLDAAFPTMEHRVLYQSAKCTLSQKYILKKDSADSDEDSDECAGVWHPTKNYRLSTRRKHARKLKKEVIEDSYMPDLNGRKFISDIVEAESRQTYHLEICADDLITKPNLYKGGSVDRRRYFIKSARLGTYSQAWDVKVLSHDGDHAEGTFTTDAFEKYCEDKNEDWLSDAEVLRLYNGSEDSSAARSREMEAELKDSPSDEPQVYVHRSVKDLAALYDGKTQSEQLRKAGKVTFLDNAQDSRGRDVVRAPEVHDQAHKL